ncbi:hypothetical protein D3C86_1740710 [compost metagenome]
MIPDQPRAQDSCKREYEFPAAAEYGHFVCDPGSSTCLFLMLLVQTSFDITLVFVHHFGESMYIVRIRFSLWKLLELTKEQLIRI